MNAHSVLRYLSNQPNIKSRQDTWLDTLSDFDFETGYIKGKENRVADALSRRVHANHISTMRPYGTSI